MSETTSHHCVCQDCGPTGCGYQGAGHCSTCCERPGVEEYPDYGPTDPWQTSGPWGLTNGR